MFKELLTVLNRSVDVASVGLHMLLGTTHHPVSPITTIQTENPHKFNKAIAQTDALV